jgi:hypothetical protein
VVSLGFNSSALNCLVFYRSLSRVPLDGFDAIQGIVFVRFAAAIGDTSWPPMAANSFCPNQ